MAHAGYLPKLTYDDYAALPEDGRRYELIDGRLLVSPAPSSWHQRTIIRLVFEIESFIRQTGAGELLIAPIDLVLSPFDVVQPDLLFMSEARRHLIRERFVAGPPDLVIEVLSPSTRRRDRVLKRRLYEACGVAEYWLVEEAAVHLARRRDGGDSGHYGEGGEAVVLTAASAAPHNCLTSPLLPGFELPLVKLLG